MKGEELIRYIQQRPLLLNEDIKYTFMALLNGLKVEQYTLDGKYITTFDSVAEAGRALGKNPSAIAVVARGSGYRRRGNFYKAKQAYGYIWKYVKLKEEGVI